MDVARPLRPAAAPLLALLLALLVPAAGCGDRGAASAPPAAAATDTVIAPASTAAVLPAAEAGVPAPAVSATPTAATSVAAATPAAGSAVKLALDPEGLRLFDANTGASRLVAFGAPQADVAAVLARVLPEAQAASPEDTDCGATIQLPRSGLITYFRDGEFTGWGLDDASTLTTVGGLGIGTTRTALEAVVVPEFLDDSTIGVEFSAGGIAGLLASKAKHARITNLWAGDTCIAR